MPIDYSKGQIYRLKCKDGHYYIGSTCSPLEIRLGHHRHAIRNNLQGGKYTYFSKVPISEISIELIEDYPCASKQALLEYEDYYIQAAAEDPLCLNTHRAYLTPEQKKLNDKEYYEMHKEECLEKMKEYYQDHKEEIAKYQQGYKEENQEKVDAYQAEYRQKNAEKRRAYSKQYALAHPEERKKAQQEYYANNKADILEKTKAYVQKNADKIKERKRLWEQRKKEENKEAIQAAKEQKAKIKAEKKAAKKEEMKQVITCECGGTYQPYRKSRHDKSKKHIHYVSSQQSA